MDFDKIIERKNTDSLKYDTMAKHSMPENILPLWVADMDFMTPDCVINALIEKSRHGIFGYTVPSREYFDILYNWFKLNHKWEVKEDWLLIMPGVVFAICTAIRALTNKGDSVLIQQPVYYPFSKSILNNGRKLVNNELVYSGGKYSIDFKDFEDKIVKNSVKLFVLCNPHNPVGRVWTKDELILMGDICLKHNVVVISDEIHMDFVYPGFRHLVFANLKPEFMQNTITCTAPSKTFNLPGLQLANIFAANPKLRNSIKKEFDATGYDEPNIMGVVSCKAAYRDGGVWLERLREYLLGNLDYLRRFLKENLPQIKLIEPEGTYLVWLDFKALNLNEEELNDLIIKGAGLWLDRGTMFGDGGQGFQRINLACPKATLERALIQLESAIEAL